MKTILITLLSVVLSAGIVLRSWRADDIKNGTTSYKVMTFISSADSVINAPRYTNITLFDGTIKITRNWGRFWYTTSKEFCGKESDYPTTSYKRKDIDFCNVENIKDYVRGTPTQN